MKKGSKDRDSEKQVSQLDRLRQLSAEELLKQWQVLLVSRRRPNSARLC
jgi:hypothetical protein